MEKDKLKLITVTLLGLGALLAMILVIPVIIFIDPEGTAEACIFEQAGFACEEDYLVSKGGRVLFIAQITNGQQKSVEIEDVACVKGSSLPEYENRQNMSLSPGAGFDTADIGLECTDARGKTLGGGKGDFAGRMYVKYRYKGDPPELPPKIAVAIVNGGIE
jgi:hypothetical protein